MPITGDVYGQPQFKLTVSDGAAGDVHRHQTRAEMLFIRDETHDGISVRMFYTAGGPN
jgi:hypothetical protein